MTTLQKGRIFISYRRDDSAGYAGRIYDRLTAHFGKDAVFMDVDTIEAGLDFVVVLQNAVQSCDVLVALIGRQWINIKDEKRERRLDNPEDFVRIEIAAALDRDIRVIPVLFDGTYMPRSTELPDNLRPLTRRNALQVNHHSFNADAHRLISQLELALKAAEESKIIKAQEIREEQERKSAIERMLKSADLAIRLKDWNLAHEKLTNVLELESAHARARGKLDIVQRMIAEQEKSYQEENERRRRQSEKMTNRQSTQSFYTGALDKKLPPLNILLTDQVKRADERTINQTAGLIEKTLDEFGITAIVIGFRVGPAATQFAVQPGFKRKRKLSAEDNSEQLARLGEKIVSLKKDLELALSMEHLRIEAPVTGKPYIGIEIPNSYKTVVRMRSILETDVFRNMNTQLAVALGRDISFQPVVTDLISMPHLLIVGATGSGKSECITAIAACLAMNNSPEDLRMVMVDPRMSELFQFNGLPHLLGSVETNIERILDILRWLVVEMEHRYRLLDAAHVHDIKAYNRRAIVSHIDIIPHIVVLIDEIVDLMMSASEITEHYLVRLAQKAHAIGIHLVITTQRPSVDVVTSGIKANFPARLAFSVTSSVDSHIILNMAGAENLLGRGDMLFLNPEVGNPIRVQGVMIASTEIDHILSYWQKNVDTSAEVPPWDKLVKEPEEYKDEELIEEAVSFVRQSQRASASLLQRRFHIGYPRAASLLDKLEKLGIVGPSLGGGKERDVLLGPIEGDR